MALTKKIVDASVIVKWFLAEKGSDKALEIQQEHINGKVTIVVHELAFLEVLNALRYKGATEKSLHEAAKHLFDLQLSVERASYHLLEKAASLALQHNISLYDAMYAALAIFYGSPLLTADKELAKIPNAMLI